MKNGMLVTLFGVGFLFACSEDTLPEASKRADDMSSEQSKSENVSDTVSDGDETKSADTADGEADSSSDKSIENGGDDSGEEISSDEEIAADDDDDDDDVVVVKGVDTENEICSTVDLDLKATPVRLMILQDLSSSMREGTPSKWVQAKQALTNMLNSFNDTVDFGFDGFPNLVQCGVDQPPFSDCMPDNKDNIISHINSIALSRSTPLYMAIQKYQDESYAPKFLSTGATRYLLIVSDGQDSCGSSGSSTIRGGGVTAEQLGELTATLLSEREVMTYVIGFGSGADPGQLNAIAKAGGTNVTEYFDAQDQTQLEKALNEIVGGSVSCVFDVEEQEKDKTDMTKVNFYFDDKVVGLDADCANGSGWTWLNDEKSKVQFCEKACGRLKNREVKEISATFGCPTEIILVF